MIYCVSSGTLNPTYSFTHSVVCPLLVNDAVMQGIGLIQDLIKEYGLNVVQAYMNHIQACY